LLLSSGHNPAAVFTDGVDNKDDGRDICIRFNGFVPVAVFHATTDAAALSGIALCFSPVLEMHRSGAFLGRKDHRDFLHRPFRYLGDPARECRCSPGQVERYRSRISGPLLDRNGIHVEAARRALSRLFEQKADRANLRDPRPVIQARERQRPRFAYGRMTGSNARTGNCQVKKFCALDSA